MEYGDMTRIANKLKANWRFMFDNKEQMQIWWTYLNEFPTEEVDQGVIRYILNNTKEPTIADIVNSIKAVRNDKRRATPMQSGRAIKCIHCRDTGLIVWEDKEGRNYGRPCTCEKGVQNYGNVRSE